MPSKIEVKERPIIFSGPSLQAILDGRKTQTRRVCKMRDVYGHDFGTYSADAMATLIRNHCPYGVPGNRLWVRETWAKHIPGCPGGIAYRADHVDPKGDGPANPITWKPSIFMPQWASRITLEVTDVRVEHVQEISEDDAKAEGTMWQSDPEPFYYSGMFRVLWNQINHKRGLGWNVNPWVWIIEFKKLPVT